ncbi:MULTISPECIES: enhanced serine sensitivity protein SseB C-terminal domain-containing protein [Terrabacteria group]|uniref:enhanced serine sensitivity protein SseB C-terminal domain-containing protein n=1 Tax=Bacillati TaxID=1783272 RepID=UPI00193AD8D5|nr:MULTISPECIES: enhanced serine sensitivity protein SseB C-terminal domain-containing protein [Terrabacteria group]MBW9212115.1 enhanced serine sensitivity protein SseB [Trueperella sp. zg.1013]QRG87081.1 enhanced serine sensitivity protein SseB C-terminal domain-containing protein [Bulleidia sp. zg-1006]
MSKKSIKNPNLKPVKNPELRKAMEELKLGSSPERQLQFIQALEKAQLLAPTKFEVALTKNHIPSVKSDLINFYLINTNDGKTFFPAFTDLERAGQFQLTQTNEPLPKMVVQTLKQYDALLSDSNTKAIGIIINPGVDNMVAPAALIHQLIHPVEPTASSVQIVEPTIYPTQLVNQMYDWSNQRKTIQRVWLKQKLENNQVSFYFILDVNEQKEDLLKEFCVKAFEFSKKIPCEAVFFNQQLKDEIIQESVPFFDRSLGF